MTIISIINTLKELDIKLLLAINGFNSDFFDYIMYGISNKFIWIPLYLILLWLSIKHYGIKSFFVIFAFILTITMADQVSVHLFKNIFQRYRPCHNLDIQGFIHLVNDKCGGKFGFISSHACNTSAVATLSILFFHKKVKWFTYIVIAYAFLNSYSRVYLGVHYPSDVLVGSIVGILCALIIFYLASRLMKNIVFLKKN